MQEIDLINTLRRGGIVFLPTDTIPGFSCRAFNRLAVEKIYQIKQRNPKRPLIILVANNEQIENLGLILNKKEEELLSGSLGRPTSVVATIKDDEKRQELFFLHRGTNQLAIRLIKKNPLKQIVLQTGPLVSTSANREGELPILNYKVAKKAFKDEIDYYFETEKNQNQNQNQNQKPSFLVRVENNEIKILRG